MRKIIFDLQEVEQNNWNGKCNTVSLLVGPPADPLTIYLSRLARIWKRIRVKMSGSARPQYGVPVQYYSYSITHRPEQLRGVFPELDTHTSDGLLDLGRPS
jgi:hypothetical protein